MVLRTVFASSPEQLMTVDPLRQLPLRGLPVGSVQERQAGLPEPQRAFHRRLLAGFLTGGGAPEPAAVADCCCPHINFHTDPQHAQTYLQAHPGMTGEPLGQADSVATARRVFGGLLDPQRRQATDDELDHREHH
jgi:hypothetical protein